MHYFKADRHSLFSNLRIVPTYTRRTMFISRAYKIAGIVIILELKTNGLEAIAIAWAAFCIATSITIVLRVFEVCFEMRDISVEIATDIITKARTHKPSLSKCSSIFE